MAWWLRRKREGANGRGADDALGARRGGAGACGKALRGGLRDKRSQAARLGFSSRMRTASSWEGLTGS